MTGETVRARQMWHLLEPLHAVLYYAPAAFEEAAALGYDTEERWASYFAWRAAPLGAAGADEVVRTFHSFAPATVARYVPASWATVPPEAVLAARLRAVDRAYRALFGDRRVEGPTSPRPPRWHAGRRKRRTQVSSVAPSAPPGPPIPPSAPPTPPCPGRTPRTSPSGTRRPSCANTGATGTSPRSERPASTRSSRSSPSRRSAPPAPRSSRAVGGASRSGARPGTGSGSAGCWRRTVRPRRPGVSCAPRWSCAPTRRPPRRGGPWGGGAPAARGAAGGALAGGHRLGDAAGGEHPRYREGVTRAGNVCPHAGEGAHVWFIRARAARRWRSCRVDVGGPRRRNRPPAACAPPRCRPAGAPRRCPAGVRPGRSAGRGLRASPGRG